MKVPVLVLLVFVLSCGIAFSQDFPVDGKWKLQIIGTTEEFLIEINDTTWTFESNNNKIPQIITIDNDRKTIIIPLFTGLADYYFFEIKDGYIDLTAGGKFNFPILDSIRTGMTSLEGINDLTDEFVEKIITEMEAAFFKVPIMRLYQN
jgi:hypothetical protein